jgi:uncharacterized membrane protein YebE (DUF533 family)
MSFARTLATLAVGFAAAKGYDKFKQMGGMPGVQDALKKNPTTAALASQMEGLMGKSGGGMGGMMGQIGAMGAAAATGAAGMFDKMTGTTMATDATEANARLMIRAMIQAAKSDGEISPEERRVILDHLGEASEEEMDFVLAQLDAPVDPIALARDTADQAKVQVYSAALTAIVVDTPAEAAYLSQLAQGLGLDATTVATIHASLGKPAPKG